MNGIAVITEACIGVKDRTCVDVCPVGAIYSEDDVPDGTANARYNSSDPNKGHDHTFFIEHSKNVFAD